MKVQIKPRHPKEVREIKDGAEKKDRLLEVRVTCCSIQTGAGVTTKNV